MSGSKSTSNRRRATTHKRISCPAITGWMRDVETGRVAACGYQHQLVVYVRRVFAEEKLYIDRAALETYLGYQRYFFELDNSERFMLALFLCVFREDGRPRWPHLLALVGRGYGKSGFAAFCDFCVMSKAHGIDNYNVDICANTEQQAKITFDSLRAVLDSDWHRFRLGMDWTKTYIENTTTRSVMRYRTNSPKSLDGMRPGLVDFDEIHQYQDWASMNVFTTGLGKVPHPRIFYLTTDGDVRDGPLDSLKERGASILAGNEPDNGLLPFMCRLDSPEEVDDESNWPKANPRLVVDDDLLEQVRVEYVNYKRDPALNASFMTKRMNCPVGRVDVQVTEWENLDAASRDVGDLSGMPCVAGIDYATLDDMVGCCLLFRAGDEWRVIPHAWVCKRGRDYKSIKAPLADWPDVEVVDDVEVHASLVGEYLHEMSQRYDVCEVRIDQYRQALMKRALSEAGFDTADGRVKVIRPSDIMRIQPVVRSAFANRSIAWGDSALMRWSANNAKLVPAPHDNWTYGKIDPRKRKTDAFLALVAAFTGFDVVETSSQQPSFSMPLVF